MHFRFFFLPLYPKLIIESFSSRIWVVKKVLLIGFTFVLGIMFTSCQSSVKETPESGSSEEIQKDTIISDSLQSEMALAIERQVVLERVRSIYSLIKQECTYLGGSVDNDLLMAVRRKEFQTNSLFFEVNRWTMTYDSNLISFDEFEVADCYIGPDNEKTATVNFTVYASDTYTPVRIELVYEDGQWKIDNFYHMKYMLNLRQSMYRYIGSDMLYLI